MAYDPDLLFKHVISCLRTNPGSSLNDISRKTGASCRTLQTVIVCSTGKRFRELRQILLVEAIRRSFKSNPVCAIKEIAFATGYNSGRSFARAVKRACGVSPVCFRNQVLNTRQGVLVDFLKGEFK